MPLIEPKPRHVLFFPNRKHNRVVNDVVELRFWSRERYKHVQIESFPVILQFGKLDTVSSAKSKPAAKTKDNLRCNVIAAFDFRARPDDKSLDKSTAGFSASRRPKNIADSIFFELGLRVQLQSLIERCLGDMDYLTLLADAHSKSNLEEKIRQEAISKADEGGFDLLSCRVDIDLSVPSPESLTEELKNKWHAYLTQKADLELITLSVAAEDKVARLELEKKTAEKEAEIQSQIDINLQLAIEEREKELGMIATRKKENDRIERENQAKISAAIQEIDQEVQRQVAIAESNLESLKIELRRTEAVRKHDEAMEILRREKDLDQLRLELAELKGLIAKATEAQIRLVGSAEAEVERLKRLAEQAVSLESRKALYEALPSVLQSAYSPTQKLTDIKCIYVAHSGSDQAENSSSAKSTDGLGSMLATMSTLPMLRESLRFLDDSQDGKKVAEPLSANSSGRQSQP